jgi:hypothetical protein
MATAILSYCIVPGERFESRCLSASTKLTPNQYRAITSHMFSAAITLAVEIQHGGDDQAACHGADIDKCLAFFDNVQGQNMLARQAGTVLEEVLLDQPH